ncbi:hypothetical protein XM38_014700 [Halomicronema hongdechloris C2206]|uniref:Uncharacterized protein n=1 Tax=Halomicronema hongdechloris C2206 TaxID=1641165 RepID=A0A1Z3HJP9_9CYAN|nr:helix-turn-helix domain-containing protein [Halomicronema hongdechloris]ASC70531.1 hypothetical protein XM38_014700 [Halomicronema hongdechloris C2206]
MEKPDARLLNPTTQNYLRQQAIRLQEQGKRFVDIAAYLGVHRNTVSDWWQQYQQLGESAPLATTARQQTGRRSHAEPEWEAMVQQQMREHFFTPTACIDSPELPVRLVT